MLGHNVDNLLSSHVDSKNIKTVSYSFFPGGCSVVVVVVTINVKGWKEIIKSLKLTFPPRFKNG